MLTGPLAALGLAVVALVVIIVVIVTIKNLIVIAPPNQAAVLTGRNRMLQDGQKVGYRSISGGRTFRVPIIERVQPMNLETIPIDVLVSNAFSKGNIPLNVEAIANVKIASQPEWVFNNAVERLLGKTDDEIRSLAQDTLTGNLRGVLATLTPEEVNEDRLGFAKALAEDAGRGPGVAGIPPRCAQDPERERRARLSGGDRPREVGRSDPAGRDRRGAGRGRHPRGAGRGPPPRRGAGGCRFDQGGGGPQLAACEAGRAGPRGGDRREDRAGPGSAGGGRGRTGPRDEARRA